ncbi:hypothetical protein CPC08DRAFT_823347 [Agrocybe pediades]|nr:hypothetical protein CPC08DRAFT_823347 [Agrocybe pediades]
MDLNAQGYAIRPADGLVTQPDLGQAAPAPSLIPASNTSETRATKKLRPLPPTRSSGVGSQTAFTMARGYEVVPIPSSRRVATEVTWVTHAGQTKAKPVRPAKKRKQPRSTRVPSSSITPLVIDAPADPNATVDIDDDVIIVNHVVPRQVNDTTFLASGSPSLPPSTHMSMPDPGLTTGRVLRPRVVTRQATYSGSDDDNHIPVQVRRGRPPGTLNVRTAKALNTKIETLEQNVEALWKTLEEQSQSVSSPGESEASAIAMLRAENAKLSEKIEKLKRKNQKLKKAVAELPEHLRGPY